MLVLLAFGAVIVFYVLRSYRASERPVNRTGAGAASPNGAAERSEGEFTKFVEVLERGRWPRGDRSVAPKRRVVAGVRTATWIADEAAQVLGRAAVAR